MTRLPVRELVAFVILVCAALSVRAQTSNDLERLPTTADSVSPLRAEQRVPRLVLLSADSLPYNLVDSIAQKPTLVIFYGGGWCPYCNMQLSELQEIESDLIESGYRVIAISTDLPERLGPAVTRYKLEYTLLSDTHAIAAAAFGVAFKSGEKLSIVPSAFLIRPNGLIVFDYVSSNYKVGVSGEIVLKAARKALLK